MNEEHTSAEATGVEIAASSNPQVADEATVTRGPRGHRGEVRERILAVARQTFIDLGYDEATIRQIARDADCDAALISYYFGTKQRLFTACFDLPIDPAQDLLSILLPDPYTAGERLVRYAVELYEKRLTSDTMVALMRALMTDAMTSQRFKHYVRKDFLDKISAKLGVESAAAEQFELAVAQMYGVATMRYIVRLEPLASMPVEQLVAELAPVIQARIDRIMRDYLPK